MSQNEMHCGTCSLWATCSCKSACNRIINALYSLQTLAGPQKMKSQAGFVPRDTPVLGHIFEGIHFKLYILEGTFLSTLYRVDFIGIFFRVYFLGNAGASY